MKSLLHALGGYPAAGIIAVLLACLLLTWSELRSQRYPTRVTAFDSTLFRVALALGVVASLAIALRFASVALGS